MKFKNIYIAWNEFLNKFKKWINYIKTTNYKDMVFDFYIVINKIMNEFYRVNPQGVRYTLIVIYCVLLWIDGHMTYVRLALFIGIIIFIGMYKWLYVNIWKLNNYININQIILLKIYKYKNPLILILIEMEIKIFYMIDYLKKRNVNIKLVKVIYNIIYNLTGINGIKIVLYRFYNIFKYWISNTMYELIFQRMFMMILSIMIFTNVIQVILEKLNAIYPSYIVWIYIFLVIISYIFHVYNINKISFNRMETNLLWNILTVKQSIIKKIELNPAIINKDVKACLGIFLVNKILNYDNLIIYLICGLNTYKWIEYNNILLNYCYKINKYFNVDYIYSRNIELKKEISNNDVINYCEYQILLYKLKIFFLWDIENQFKVHDTLLIIEGSQGFEDLNINNLNINFNKDKTIYITFDYNINKLEKCFYEKGESIIRDNFWNLIKNKKFYKEFISYINDYNFQNMFGNIKIKNAECKVLITLEDYIEDYSLSNIEHVEFSEITYQIQLIKQELINWRIEWNQFQGSNNFELKYNVLFNKINDIKNKVILKC